MRPNQNQINGLITKLNPNGNTISCSMYMAQWQTLKCKLDALQEGYTILVSAYSTAGNASQGALNILNAYLSNLNNVVAQMNNLLALCQNG